MDFLIIQPALAQASTSDVIIDENLPIKLFFGYLFSFVIIILFAGFGFFLSRKLKEKFNKN